MAAALQLNDFVGKQYQFESKNYPNHFIRHQNWKVFMHKHDAAQLYQLDSTFDIIPGIAGQGISFRSVNYPAYFIRHKGGNCFIHSADGSQLFKNDASWIPCQGLADPNGVSFESVNFPKHYLRHRNSRLHKDEINTTQLFKEDATWYPKLIKDKEAKQGVKETIQVSLVQTDGPAQNLPNILTEKLELKDAELEAALLRERQLQQQLEEANKNVEREKEETRKQIKDIQEKEAEVKEPLRITLHPNDITKHCKQGAMLTVRASGSGNITYQWIKDGEFFSEDDLANCIGVTSDTLQFLSLSSEHSGTYVCRVCNENASVESKTADLKVISKMNLVDFLKETAERQDVLVIIRDDLKQKVQAYIQELGLTCVDDLDSILEDIEDQATVTYDDAIIDFTTQRVETKLSYIGTPKVFTNSKLNDHEEQFHEDVTYTVGSETSKTKVQGWSVSGGLVGGYEGVQAGAGATYERQTHKTQLAFRGVDRTETFDKTILVPRESRVKVAIEKQVKTFICNVKDLKVTLSSKKSTIKCKCERKEKKKPPKAKMFRLEDIFGDGSNHSDGKELTIRLKPLNGKCTWSETSVSVHCFDPEPLKRHR